MAMQWRKPSSPSTDNFPDDMIVPGEVLVTLAPDAAAYMTASVPVHPSGPVDGLATELGVSDLDGVLADLGAHDITRLAVPGSAGGFASVLDVDALDEAPLGRTFRVRIAADADVDDAVAKLAKVDSVEVAEPNRYRVTQVIPNDARYGEQWGLPKINAPTAWERTKGDASVVVAVVDTGVDRNHPELAGLLVPGYDMVDLGPNPTPPYGWRFEGDFSGRDSDPVDEVNHGTHVAGTIAAATDNRVGVAGVTWKCRIQPVKALTRMVNIKTGEVRGVGTSVDIAAAIQWAADHGAKVINLSLGSSSPTEVERNAVAYAISRDVVVVAAMGNNGSSRPSYPAAFDGVISVGAIDSTDRKATFSQTGPHIDVVAPGVAILSTVPGGGYGNMSGTSMASPHVAGVAALIRSVKPEASVAEVTDIIRSTARALRTKPTDPVPNNDYGWGLVDAAAAVAKAKPLVIPRTILCQPRTVLSGCGIPKTILAATCEPPKTLPPKCPIRTTKLVECGPPTALPPQCPAPIVLNCPPPTIRCPKTTSGWCFPPTARCPETANCPPTTLVGKPVTVTARAGAYDPYGYFAEATDVELAGQEQVDQEQAGPSEMEEAWRAGYLAALGDLQEQAGEQYKDPYDLNPFQE